MVIPLVLLFGKENHRYVITAFGFFLVFNQLVWWDPERIKYLENHDRLFLGPTKPLPSREERWQVGPKHCRGGWGENG
jgi:hypothetical protein